MTQQPTLIERNVAAMVHQALAALPVEHQQRRIAWCQAHDQHGCQLSVDHELGSFAIEWGGEVLVSGRATALFDEHLPTGQLVRWGEPPDTVAELLGEDQP